MIFVTVGTHEQPFDRLFIELERLVQNKEIQEIVKVQSGYTDFSFRFCEASKFLSFQEMETHIKTARIVITHGGPATICQIRESGKMPLVVPRQRAFGEHVNDHQVDFCKRLAQDGAIRLVLNTDELWPELAKYNDFDQQLGSLTPESSRQELCAKLTTYCRDFKPYFSKPLE